MSSRESPTENTGAKRRRDATDGAGLNRSGQVFPFERLAVHTAVAVSEQRRDALLSDPGREPFEYYFKRCVVNHRPLSQTGVLGRAVENASTERKYVRTWYVSVPIYVRTMQVPGTW